MTASVRVGGVWLQSLGHVSVVKWSSRWGSGPCGPDTASCALAVDPANDASIPRIGQTAEIWSDGVQVFGGVVAETGRGFPRALSLRGWSRRGEDFDAIDGSGVPSSNPQESVTTAIARGLPWSDGGGWDNVSIGVGTPSARRLNALLTEWADLTGKRWGVLPSGLTFVSAEPTTVDYNLDASALDIGVADDGLYTRVRARYVSAVDGSGNPLSYDTEVVDDTDAQALYGVLEYNLDLTPLGIEAASSVGDYVQAQLDLLLRPRWLSRVTVSNGSLLTPAGIPAHLPTVRAGQVVRLFNVPNLLGGLRQATSTVVVLGEVEYDTTQPAQITLGPVNLTSNSVVDLAKTAFQAAA